MMAVKIITTFDEQKQAMRDKLEELFQECDKKGARYLSVHFIVKPQEIPYCRYSIETYLPYLPEKRVKESDT